MKSALLHALLVGVGGAMGALLRYGVSGLVHRQFPQTLFPVGTLVVNLSGCLLIGIVAGLAESRQLFTAEMRVFVMIGILGGFTTFSAFGLESYAMLREANYAGLAGNIALQVCAGLALVWAGYAMTVSR